MDSHSVKYVTGNKRFWKTVKPFLSYKTKTCDNIILTENNQTVREDKQICQISNKNVANVTKGLKLREADKFKSFESEESSKLIKEHYVKENFSFNLILKDDIIKAVKKTTFEQSINLK